MISQLLVVISLSLVIGSWRPRSYMEPATDLAGGWGVIATIIGGGSVGKGTPHIKFIETKMRQSLLRSLGHLK